MCGKPSTGHREVAHDLSGREERFPRCCGLSSSSSHHIKKPCQMPPSTHPGQAGHPAPCVLQKISPGAWPAFCFPNACSVCNCLWFRFLSRGLVSQGTRQPSTISVCLTFAEKFQCLHCAVPVCYRLYAGRDGF